MKKNVSSLIFVLIGILLGFMVVFLVNITKEKQSNVPVSTPSQSEYESSDDSDNSSSEEESKVQQKLEISKNYYKDVLYQLEEMGEEYELELTPGNYVVGVDIPVGLYSLQVASGVGKIDINNTQQGIFISEEISNDVKTYEDTYTDITNLKLYDNTILSISGTNIKLNSNNAQPNSIREKSENAENIKELNLSAIYESGVDFPAGVYDIEYIEGVGTVVTEGIENGGIAITFTSDDEMGKTYKNVELPANTKLIINGVKIKMIPSNRGFEINK